MGKPHKEWSGRHELDTIYCAISLTDTVKVTEKPADTGFSLELDGTHLGDLASSQADMRRNHAVLALFAMAEAAGREPNVALSITKRIPVGGGLAGGSADAAATILGLNELWDLHWPVERLQQVAATLGADMPFCVAGGYARGTGYGERIETFASQSPEAQSLRSRVLPARWWWAHINPSSAPRRSTLRSIGSARETGMPTTCRRRPSACIHAAARPSNPR